MIKSNQRPREKPFADANGSYEVAIRLTTPVLDPGDSLHLQLFFTGYGTISQAKLLFFPSDSVFDPKNSWIESSLKQNHDGSFSWGATKDEFDGATPAILSFGGIQLPNWEEGTSFLDIAEVKNNILLTETACGGKAPIEMSLKTLDNIKSGKYYIEFCFTYYDGQKWRSGTKRAEFTVRSFIERNQQKITYWGLAASVIGLALGAARLLI